MADGRASRTTVLTERSGTRCNGKTEREWRVRTSSPAPGAGNSLPVLPKLRLPARSAHEHGYCGGRSSVTTDGGNVVIKRIEQ
ncbi:unnamed protein product [Macrosiphum euphorbiae]|uniref:Uncharacterized protein n=1 Tax=Macrosiphum euphorbiae TaxID=13131 RepID=A0AAV0W8W0_9HEMI|nr:unnamed protein product [Macrosiphum euphorbiae]